MNSLSPANTVSSHQYAFKVWSDFLQSPENILQPSLAQLSLEKKNKQ